LKNIRILRVTVVFLLGNENNYGLWDGAETENIPLEDGNQRLEAHALYKLLIKR
jgi:hypothetical protein